MPIFPTNPTDQQEETLGSRVFRYDAASGRWNVYRAPSTGSAAITQADLTAAVSNAGGGTETVVDLSSLPESPAAGDMAFVSSTNELYLYNGSAWFNIALTNQAPAAITGESPTYTLAIDGTPTVVTLASTDPEGFPLTWSASVTGDTNVASITNVDNVFTITPSTNSSDAGTLNVTFSVTDGASTQTTESVFTLSFDSPYFENVRSLLKVDSNSITDVTGTYTFTENGSGGGPSTTQTKFASHSLQVSSTYNITTAGSFLQKDYGSSVTYEAWVWVNDRSSEFQIASNWDGTGYQAKWYIATDGKMIIDPGSYAWDFAGMLVVPTGQWNHVVVQITAADANDKAVAFGYLNGVRGGAVQGSMFTVIQAGSGNTTIGPGPGYIESLQISEGLKYGGNPTMIPSMPSAELSAGYQNGL